MNREALKAAAKAYCGEQDWRTLIKLENAVPGAVAAMLRDINRAIEAYQATLAKAGYKILPREPTEEMIKVMWFSTHPRDDWQAGWDAYPDKSDG